jgi:hypothetical protein
MEPDMVVRVAALTALVAAPTVLVAAAHADSAGVHVAAAFDSLGRAAAASGADAETLAVATFGATADTTGAFAADVAVLSALDDLLADPVRLVRADVDRLRVLPWLDADDLAALGAALPIANAADLMARTGWPRDVVARTAPFLRFAPAAPIGVALHCDARRTEVRLSHAALGIAARIRGGRAGCATARRGDATATVGDLRLGLGQGLLVWTSSLGLDVGAAPVRRAPGIVAATSRSGVRGAGVEWRRRRSQAFAAGGRTPAGRAAAAAGARARFGATWVGLAWARAEGRDGFGIDAARRHAAGRLAAEAAATAGGGAGGALAFEGGRGRAAFGLRLQATRGALLGWAGVERGTESARAVLATARLEGGGRALEVEALHASAETPLGERTSRWAWSGRGACRLAGARVGLHVVHRERRRASLVAGGEALRATRALGVTATVRVVRPGGWQVGADARARGDPARLDRAWQAAAERNGRNTGATFSVASFVAARRWTLSIPGAGAADGAATVRGDGIRVAAALRLAWRGCTLGGVAAWIWGDPTAPRVRADAALALHWPP